MHFTRRFLSTQLGNTIRHHAANIHIFTNNVHPRIGDVRTNIDDGQQQARLSIEEIKNEKKTSYFAYKLTRKLNSLFEQGNVSSAISLFSSLVQLNNTRKAEIVEEQKRKTGKKNAFLFVRPSVPVYNTLLKGLAAYGYPLTAYKFFIDMKKRGLTPNPTTFTLLIESVTNRKLHDHQGTHENTTNVQYMQSPHVQEKQVASPMEFCWDRFQETKGRFAAEENRIVLNSLIKACGYFGTNLDTLRMIFSPFEEESEFPLSPSFGIKPENDTFSIAIKAAASLGSPVEFIISYFQRALMLHIVPDLVLVCTLLSTFKGMLSKHSQNSFQSSGGSRMRPDPQLLILEKTKELKAQFTSLAPFKKSTIFHGLILTIYISLTTSSERTALLDEIRSHYEQNRKSLVGDPITLSIYLQTFYMQDETIPASKIIKELSGHLKYFSSWSLKSQLEVLSTMLPYLMRIKSGWKYEPERGELRGFFEKLEEMKILSTIRSQLSGDHACHLSPSVIGKTSLLIKMLHELNE